MFTSRIGSSLLWSRREWMTVLAAAGAAWGRTGIGLDRISVITDESAVSEADSIRFAQHYGLKWLELRSIPKDGRGGGSYATAPLKDVRAYARMLSDNGLGVSFFNTGLLKTWLPGTELHWRRNPSAEQKARTESRGREEYERRLELLDMALERADILQVKTLRVFAFLRTHTPEAEFPRIAEILAEMGERARKAGKQLLLENETATNVATCAETVALLRQIPGDSIGINWDPMNGVEFKENPFPEGYRRLPAARIGNVQIKGKTLLMPEHRLDWAAMMQRLTADGYSGCFGLETHIWDDPGVVEWSHRSMAEIRRILGVS